MERQAILQCVEDKEIHPNKDWYLHATRRYIETIQSILNEGIVAPYLRG